MEEIGKFTNLTKMGVNKIIVNFLEETEKFTNPPESIRKDDVWNFNIFTQNISNTNPIFGYLSLSSLFSKKFL